MLNFRQKSTLILEEKNNNKNNKANTKTSRSKMILTRMSLLGYACLSAPLNSTFLFFFFATFLRNLGKYAGYFEDACRRIGDTLGTHWGHIWDALGAHWERIGNALGTHWGRFFLYPTQQNLCTCYQLHCGGDRLKVLSPVCTYVVVDFLALVRSLKKGN